MHFRWRKKELNWKDLSLVLSSRWNNFELKTKWPTYPVRNQSLRGSLTFLLTFSILCNNAYRLSCLLCLAHLRYGMEKAQYLRMAPILTMHLGSSMDRMALFHFLGSHLFALRRLHLNHRQLSSIPWQQKQPPSAFLVSVLGDLLVLMLSFRRRRKKISNQTPQKKNLLQR